MSETPEPPCPARRPCPSCPYRRDVPSGIWDASEYAKLPGYDQETWAQPSALFFCHQRDQRLCAGWVAVHDMENNLALRLAAGQGGFDGATIEAVLDYRTAVALFGSGQEAAEHGVAAIEYPDQRARSLINKITTKKHLEEQEKSH